VNGRKLTLFRTKWFSGKDELILFFSLCLIGLLSSIFGARLLNGYPYNFGKNLAGLFVLPSLCLIYITYSCYRYGLKPQVLVKTTVLFCLQAIPYAPLFLQIFYPTGQDDFSRYYLYAKNMVKTNTLWGGDKLFFKDAGYHYVTQPGYRYFVYLELLSFGNLYRFVQFINIGFYLLTVYFFQRGIIGKIQEKKLKLCLLLLVLSFSPYLIKNLLMGLPEWVTVILLMWASYCYLALNRRVAAVFLLGLVPFFRQNLLIAVLLLFVWMLINSKRKSNMIALFVLPLLLPIYHNLYYADEWRFFVDVFQLPFFNYDENNQDVIGLNYSLIFSNIIHYFGFDIENGKVVFSLIAALFLPYATVLYFYFIRLIPTAKYKFLFLLISMSAIAPIILFGNAYYPRFELVNVAVALVSFLLLYDYLSPKTKKKD
jgi:hypothetical protein